MPESVYSAFELQLICKFGIVKDVGIYVAYTSSTFTHASAIILNFGQSIKCWLSEESTTCGLNNYSSQYAYTLTQSSYPEQ